MSSTETQSGAARADDQQDRLKKILARIGPEAFTAEDYNPGILRHIVLFQYAATTSAAQRAEVARRFLALQDECRRKGGARYLLDIETGAQASGEGIAMGFDQGFLVSLKSEGDRNYYVGTPVITDPRFYDPAHQAFKDFIAPLVSAALVFDFAIAERVYLKASPVVTA